MSYKEEMDNNGGVANSHKQGQADEPMDVKHELDNDFKGTWIGEIFIPPPVPAHIFTESKGPRLIIKNVINRNFKSNAGDVVLGPFHHCFTPIVGPNGIGKSDVIDSMLFVFDCRTHKLATLIHNSANFPNMEMCSVAVHFEQIIDTPNSNDCVIVPNSGIIIERTVCRDNSSYYSMDGCRVEFDEVIKSLKQHNIDLEHNRFILLQDEVVTIGMMMPKAQHLNDCGMLEYLENIIGTSRYIYPLQLIYVRIEQLSEEHTEKALRSKIDKREMEDLENSFNEAIEYLRLENVNIRVKNLRLQKYISEKTKSMAKLAKKHDVLLNALKNNEETAKLLKTEREGVEDVMRNQLDELEALHVEKKDIESKLEETKTKESYIRQTIDITKDNQNAFIRQITQNEKQLKEFIRKENKNCEELKKCEQIIVILNEDKDQYNEELKLNSSEFKKQTQPLMKKLYKLERKLFKIDNVYKAKEEQAGLESQLKVARNDEPDGMLKYESLQIALEQILISLNAKKEQLEGLLNEVPEINIEISIKTIELQELCDEKEALQNSMRKIIAEMSEPNNQQANDEDPNIQPMSGEYSEKSLEEIQTQVDELETKFFYGQEDQKRLEEKVQHIEMQIEEYKTAIRNLQITSESLEKQLPIVLNRIMLEEDQDTDSDAAKVTDLEEKIKNSKQSIQNSEDHVSVLIRNIANLKKQIEDISCMTVESGKAKLSSVENELKTLNANMTTLNGELKNSKKNVNRMRKHSQSLQDEGVDKLRVELKKLYAQRSDFLAEKSTLEKAIADINEPISKIISSTSSIQNSLNVFKKCQRDNNRKRVKIHKKLKKITNKTIEFKNQVAQWLMRLQHLKLNDIPQAEGASESIISLKTYTKQELANYTFQDIHDMEIILGNKPNMLCISEYISKRNVYFKRAKLLEDIASRCNQMCNAYEEVRKRRYTEFMNGFRVIMRKLNETYKMFTVTGETQLAFVDSMDPFTKGISFNVRPPQNTWKHNTNLSGEDKTLSSLALVFALQYYKPSALYFMDGIDASLDLKNESIVLNYIKDRSKNSQFLIASLRLNMNKVSNILVDSNKVNDNEIKPPILKSLPQASSIQMHQKPTSLVENKENVTPQNREDDEVIINDHRINL